MPITKSNMFDSKELREMKLTVLKAIKSKDIDFDSDVKVMDQMFSVLGGCNKDKLSLYRDTYLFLIELGMGFDEIDVDEAITKLSK